MRIGDLLLRSAFFLMWSFQETIDKIDGIIWVIVLPACYPIKEEAEYQVKYSTGCVTWIAQQGLDGMQLCTCPHMAGSWALVCIWCWSLDHRVQRLGSVSSPWQVLGSEIASSIASGYKHFRWHCLHPESGFIWSTSLLSPSHPLEEWTWVSVLITWFRKRVWRPEGSKENLLNIFPVGSLVWGTPI